jgi:hypothetical protein
VSSFGVLVATRNRPEHLWRLLSSLTALDLVLSKVVIVSSGKAIDEVIQIFSNKLTIIHAHLTSGGQVRQKMHGITQFGTETDWVLFLDDDLLVSKSALSQAEQVITNYSGSTLQGIGFSLPMTKTEKQNNILKFFSRVFCLHGLPGKILTNGHAVSYSESQLVILTQWLNGASLWRRESLKHYQSDFIGAKYSAYEDVIFSYAVGKNGTLLYAPECVLEYQEEQPDDVSNYEAFHSASYWRYYFVCSNPELSKLGLLWSQIGRSLDFTYRTPGGLSGRIKAFALSMPIFFDLVFFTTLRTDPLKVLKLRLKRID